MLMSTYDKELIPGATNVVETCIRLKPEQKVYLLTDRRTLSVGLAIRDAVEKVGSPCTFQVLEDYCSRPVHHLPDTVMDCLDDCDVAIYVVYPQEGELSSRQQFVSKIEKNNIKYAHMVGITEDIMCQGMRADFNKVDEISKALMKYAEKAKTITVKSRFGTDMVATFSPDLKWRKTSGIIEEVWSNLPGGEIFTTPLSVDGKFVVDGSVGDYFSEKYGVLAEKPMILELEKGYLKTVQCENKELEKEFWDYCHTAEHSDRIGEFAIGTNLAVFEFTGNLLQDEKMPGIHIAFGDPYGSQTGADWKCPTHIDVITGSCDIWIDDLKVMENGIFLAETLGFDYSYLQDDASVNWK